MTADDDPVPYSSYRALLDRMAELEDRVALLESAAQARASPEERARMTEREKEAYEHVFASGRSYERHYPVTA